MRRYFGILFSLFLLISVLSKHSLAATQEITIEGKLVVSITDDFKNGVSNTIYSLETSSGNLILLNYPGNLSQVKPGSRLQVSGTISGNTITVNSFQVTATATVSSVQSMGTCQCDLGSVTQNNCILPSQPLCTGKFSCACSLAKKVAVILFNFQNDTSQPFTLDETRRKTFTDSDSVKAFYQEVSFGQINLTGKFRSDGDIFGWYTIPYNKPLPPLPCDYKTWTSSARSIAQNNGVDLAGYDNYIYLFPYTLVCNWSGAAEVGQNEVWVNFFYSLSVVGHELGHNFGLYHANTYNCVDPTGKRVPISDNCTQVSYGDPFDIMDSGSSYHMNNFFKGVLNWYQPVNTLTVTSDGNYSIAPIERSTTGVQALRVPKDRDSFGNIINYYYLEYRQPYGFDNTLTSSVTNGVSIRIAPEFNRSTDSLLIDTSSDTNSFSDAPLAVGKTFTDTYRGITIKTLSASTSEASVSINFGPTIILNSASNESCDQKCFSNGGSCVGVRANVPMNGTRMTFDGTFCTIANSVCSVVLKNLNQDCSGIPAEWSYCTCQPLPSPTPSTTLTPKPTPGPITGDLDGDGRVNGNDAKILLSNWFTPLYNLFIVDNKVNSLDFGIIFKNWTGP
ncbi:hypothetical protein A3D00_01575 [Candidatus Woesebacteria bacterium RIFCSPHIGHO2_02_FULL_38_9]|nr:MAG: hypothetical protein A3D00_01575 [Candidatus Woesebacteria bacterium RIFCSPHIGHO2_02_FULL_38_9]OGM57048.1 MAG: hypothetical protein A3A50_05295 [Candidatus Woesebacteria bacterium RIFCSPLOWO2_01_FULL_38_20]